VTRVAGRKPQVWFQGTGRVLSAGRPQAYSRAYLTPPGVERLKPRARKAYLTRRLDDVDNAIDAAIDRLAEDVQGADDVTAAAEPLRNAEHWTTILRLGYLMAEREALAEVIDGL